MVGWLSRTQIYSALIASFFLGCLPVPPGPHAPRTQEHHLGAVWYTGNLVWGDNMHDPCASHYRTSGMPNAERETRRSVFPFLTWTS